MIFICAHEGCSNEIDIEKCVFCEEHTIFFEDQILRDLIASCGSKVDFSKGDLPIILTREGRQLTREEIIKLVGGE